MKDCYCRPERPLCSICQGKSLKMAEEIRQEKVKEMRLEKRFNDSNDFLKNLFKRPE